MYKDGIRTIDNNNYYFNSSGALQIGWFKVTRSYGDGYTNTNWYYSNEEGILQAGWLELNGKTYYLNPYSFSMYAGAVYEIDGKYYSFDENGVCQGEVGIVE